MATTHQEGADFRWVLSVDGSSNQQRNGAGIILEGPDRLLIEQALRFAFKASNNQAEYEALIAGMLLAKEMRAKGLLAKSESLLVTGQVTGEYQAKDPQIAAYLEYVQVLKESFKVFELVQVPREQNARADLLAKLTSSGKGGRQRTVIQETLKTPRTSTGKKKSLPMYFFRDTTSNPCLMRRAELYFAPRSNLHSSRFKAPGLLKLDSRNPIKGKPLEQRWALLGSRYHVEPALPIFKRLLVQAQDHSSSNSIQADPRPIPGFFASKKCRQTSTEALCPK